MNKKISRIKYQRSKIQTVKPLNPLKEIIIPFVVTFITVFLLIYIIPLLSKNKKNVSKKEVVSLIEEKSAPKEKIKELIELEKYLYIDPLVVLKLIDTNDEKIMIMDIRDSASYKKAHIKGAVNYSTDKLKKDMQILKKKRIIIYGDTISSVQSKEVALSLIEKGIDARLMSVGWNEFRHFRNLWIPESQWDIIDVNKYIEINE